LDLNSTQRSVTLAKRKNFSPEQHAEDPLARLLRLVVSLALDRGFSVQDVEFMLRLAATKIGADRQVNTGRRLNISGIAAATGLSRSDVANLCVASKRNARWKQKPIDRIVSGWQSDRRYFADNNRPLDLPIYGRAPSFQSLVAKYATGFPARAVLDELLARGDVTVLPQQYLRISNRRKEPSNDLPQIEDLIDLLRNNEAAGQSAPPRPKRTNLKRS
jgi:hypothetical protein